MSLPVISFGAVVWDIIDGKEYIGGAPFNVAAHMAKQGCESYIITRLGKDIRGIRAIDEIVRMGVDLSFVQTDLSHPTGTAMVTLTGQGIPAFEVPVAAFDFIEVDNDLLKKLAEQRFEVVCFGTIEQRSEVTRKSLYQVLDVLNTSHVFYDVNIRLGFYPEEIIRESMNRCTIIKMNNSEMGLMSECLYGRSVPEEEFAALVSRDFLIETVCITKGEDGCTVYHGGRYEVCPGHKVKVVDTVGSGDAFSAAFLRDYIQTGDPFKSAPLGNIMGAYVASKSGAVPDYTEDIKRQAGIPWTDINKKDENKVQLI